MISSVGFSAKYMDCCEIFKLVFYVRNEAMIYISIDSTSGGVCRSGQKRNECPFIPQ